MLAALQQELERSHTDVVLAGLAQPGGTADAIAGWRRDRTGGSHANQDLAKHLTRTWGPIIWRYGFSSDEDVSRASGVRSDSAGRRRSAFGEHDVSNAHLPSLLGASCRVAPRVAQFHLEPPSAFIRLLQCLRGAAVALPSSLLLLPSPYLSRTVRTPP